MSIKKLELKLQDPKKYYALSHKLGIAQIKTKELQEKLFGLECNFEEFNGIDFKKGCYVGQENLSIEDQYLEIFPTIRLQYH